MNGYAVTTRSASASIRITVDLLLGPVAIALALLFSLLLPVTVHAQTLGGAGVDYAYQRTMASIVSGSAAGVQISRGATMNILNGGRIVGAIALNEKRLIDLATMAKIARASTVPGIIALGATELLNYGLQKCLDGSLGWCVKAGPSGLIDGYKWYDSTSTATYWDSPEEACTALRPGTHPVDINNGSVQPVAYYECRTVIGNSSGKAIRRATTCASGYAMVNGTCVETVPRQIPAKDADVENAWRGAFQAKPELMVNSYGFEDQTLKNQQWADAMAQLAEVIAPTSVSVAEPAVSTTTPAGTTKVQRICTYEASPNSSSATMKDQPVSVGTTCITTTTNPDGTVSTKTETVSPEPKGATSLPPKVDIDTCGLPGKPACKIDETGTPQGVDSKTAVAVSTSLDKLKTDTQTAIDDAIKPDGKETSWASWIPTIPSVPCQPIPYDVNIAHGVIDICTTVDKIQVLCTFAWVIGTAYGCVREVKDTLDGA